MNTEEPVIRAEGVRKRFGTTVALDGVDLTVKAGRVTGLLGPNGSGKTTLIRILSTLIQPDGGTVHVAGLDVVRNAAKVRTRIGLAGQFAAVDEALTGRENLEIVGRLYQLGRSEANRRAVEALERLNLTEAADRPVRTYSGGMRRRLDLGASLVGRPEVLLLDEPTTGLDPRTRLELWDFLKDLVAGGTTILLTTQYLDEADELADRISVIDHGRLIAEGTADELKSQVGGDVLVLTVTKLADLPRAAALLNGLGGERSQIDERNRRVTVAVSGTMTSADKGPRAVESLLAAVRAVDEAGIAVDDLGLRRPSLDDVFLALTGHAAAEEPVDEPVATKRRGRSRSAA